MNFLPVYLDASAIVKLVVPEAETQVLMLALARWPDRVSSALAEVEVHRAIRRAGGSGTLRKRADAVLSAMVLLRVDDPVLKLARTFKEPTLRTIDAVHLATALSIGDDPEAFITYDARLGQAAAKQRLTVQHPGVDRLG